MSQSDEQYRQISETTAALLRGILDEAGYLSDDARERLERLHEVHSLFGRYVTPPDLLAGVERKRQEHAELFERTRAFKMVPEHRKRREVLEALADDRLTQRQLVDRLLVHYPGAHINAIAYPLLKRLMESGEVDRVRDGAPRAGRPTWRYYRRSELTGPIADLQRALDKPAAGETR